MTNYTSMMYNRTSRRHFAIGLGNQRRKGRFNVTKPESGHPKPTLQGLGSVIRKEMAAYNYRHTLLASFSHLGMRMIWE